MLFMFMGPVFKTLLLQANVSELERLAERDGTLYSILGATVHAEVQVFVCGFNMQVSLYWAIF